MTLYFRKIQVKDLEKIRKWRMREDITKYMNTDPVLTDEGQREWLARITENGAVRSWIIEVDAVPAGVLNLVDIDPINQRCSWGYYVAEKNIRSLQLAMTIEWNLYDYVFYELKLNKLTNEVFALNKEVVTIHKMCGSDIVGTFKEHIYKKGCFYDVVFIEICKSKWQKIKEKYTYIKAEFE
jgi:UDP-4-amino-4,6-dideoxy-N-acetyl-beta-L-altrosamine N-acetyltransferase